MKRFLALSLLVPLSALAQSSKPPSETILIGAGVRVRPAYDGSASLRTDVVPLLDYDGRVFFARTSQGVLEGGAHAKLGSGATLGAQLAYEQGRKSKESSFLRNRGVADIGAGASVGLHVQWDTKIGPMPVLLLGRVRQQIENDRGAQADLRATAGVYQSGPLAAGVFAQTTWGNRKSVNAYYGQPGVDLAGGLRFSSVGLLGSYDLAPRWALFASLEGRRLGGAAARSPLVERRSNYYAISGLAYRFPKRVTK